MVGLNPVGFAVMVQIFIFRTNLFVTPLAGVLREKNSHLYEILIILLMFNTKIPDL